MAAVDGVREFVLDFFHRGDDPFSSFVLDRPVDRPAGESMAGIRDVIGITSVYWFRRYRVVDFLSGYIESLNGASSRSIVAGLIARSWACTSGV